MFGVGDNEFEIGIAEARLKRDGNDYKLFSPPLFDTMIQCCENDLRRKTAIPCYYLPAARSGILAAIVLGMGRAIGETMAVYMVMGNCLLIPEMPTDCGRTLTTTPALEIKYAADVHWNALFADGIILLIFILLLNSTAMILRRRQFK